MKKSLFALWLVVTNLLIVKADPLSLDSICIVQPSGDTLWSRLQGDEFYHWRSTLDGHVIMRDSNHCFYYATIEGDSILQPSTIVAHNAENRNLLEQSYLNIHSESIKQFVHSEIQKNHMIAELDSTLIPIPNAQHAANNGQRQPVIGTRKVLTILVEFEDRKFSREKVEFDSLMNQRSGAVGPNHGSVRQYYQENSYGQLTIESIVVGPIEVPYSYSNYQRDKKEGSAKVRKLVRRALKRVEDIVDFSTLDGDNDGYVDCVHIVYAGTRYMNSSTDIFIWPHKGTVTADGISDYIITPELNDDGAVAPIGTICHELGHILGAPDFYDDSDILFPMGKYDVMDRGNQNGMNIYSGSSLNKGYCPAQHNPYTKCYIFKWDTPKVIHPDSRTYVLSSSTKNKGHIYRINTKTAGEYFLLEYRTNDGFDGDIPNGGLLIYHAHADLETCIEKGDSINGDQPMKFYLINGGSYPSDGELYGNAFLRRAFPGQCNDRTMFTRTTTPSARAWDGRDIGVDICFIQLLDFGKLSFTVNPRIMGSSQLCGLCDYSVASSVPENDSIVWSYSTDIAESPMYPALHFMGESEGHMVLLERGNTIALSIKDPDNSIMRSMINPQPFPEVPHVGSVTLKATVHGGNGTYQMEKELELPEFVTPSLAPSHTHWPIYAERTLSDTSCTHIKPEHIKWYVRYPNSLSEYEYTGHDVALQPVEAGEMTVRVVNSCGCEASNEATYTYSVVNAGPMSYPNPVTTAILPIDIMRYDDDAALCTIELWHYAQGRVDSMSTTGNRIELYVSDLPADWYQLVLLRNGQILDSGNVLISH